MFVDFLWEKGYFGRFFKVTPDLSIWAGYDPNPNYGFNISFSFKKNTDSKQKLEKVLQSYTLQEINDEKDKKYSWFVININSTEIIKEAINIIENVLNALEL